MDKIDDIKQFSLLMKFLRFVVKTWGFNLNRLVIETDDFNGEYNKDE